MIKEIKNWIKSGWRYRIQVFNRRQIYLNLKSLPYSGYDVNVALDREAAELLRDAINEALAEMGTP